MINPTVGRKVWYRPGSALRDAALIRLRPEDPLDATVVAVCNEHCVNLVVRDANGSQHTRLSVYLTQPGVTVHDYANVNINGYAEWMPYQVSQAKKDDPVPPQPPTDNAHVTEGCEQFGETINGSAQGGAA